MPLNCSLVGFALEGGAFSDIIENINVSEVNDHNNLPISSLVEESYQARKFVGLFYQKLHLTCPFQDKQLSVAEALHSISSMNPLQTSLRTLMATTPTKETLRNLVKREELGLMTVKLVNLKLVLL